MVNSEQPLRQKRVLVTRARKQASAIVAKLRALGALVVDIPTIEVRPPKSYAALDRALHSLRQYQWLILTSVNGVDALIVRMAQLALPLDALRGLHIAAIGPATRRALEAQGLQVEVVPEKYVAEDVVAALRERVAGQRVLLVRAKVARDVIPKELTAAGAEVDVAEAYETVLPEGTEEALSKLFADPAQMPHLVCFMSSSTAINFLKAAPHVAPLILEGEALCASIGPITSGALRERGLPVAIEASDYTVDGLVEAIRKYYAGPK